MFLEVEYLLLLPLLGNEVEQGPSGLILRLILAIQHDLKQLRMVIGHYVIIEGISRLRIALLTELPVCSFCYFLIFIIIGPE